MLGMAQLSQEHGRGELGQGDAKTEHHTTTGEDADAAGRALHSGTSDHDAAADDDRRLAAETISHPGATYSRQRNPKPPRLVRVLSDTQLTR